MGEYFMGEEIQAAELPLDARRPDVTPPEGVILTKTGLDGWTRKTLYQAGLGSNGQRWERSMIVSVIPPSSREIPRTSMGIDRSYATGRAKPALMSGGPVSVVPGGLRLGQISPTAPTAPPVSANPDADLPAPPGEEGTSGQCPGPIEMPDGRVINPEDSITFKDFCEMAPYFMEAMQKAAQGQRTGPVSLVGQPPGYAQVISPAGGMFGQSGQMGGGGGMVGFPGGGGGAQGARGVQGPAGPPAEIDYLTKVDGDYTAGPGAFVPVPGTQKSFLQGSDGPCIFLLQATFGCAQESSNSQIGLRLTDSDGIQTTFPLSPSLAHTAVAGVALFLTPANGMWPTTLSKGTYTVEVMLRGISAGEFCGQGQGFSASVSANTEIPLAMAILHR